MNQNRKPLLALILLALWVLTNCGPAPTPTPATTATPVVVEASLPVESGESGLAAGCPNPDCIFITPFASTPEPLRFDLPTPGAERVSAWRPAQYPVPLALGLFDHFYFARPIGADEVNWPIADYRYGGTFLNKESTHTGVDISAKAGTPVLASGPGTIIWAGWGLFSNTPDNIKDPYGMAVAIRHDFGYQGQPLYTVYAHMRKVDVAVGQWVETGTQLGEVGATGRATGPHLHFEVRLGKNSYYYTRNPELWLAPAQGWGVLTGRITGDGGKLSNNTPVVITSLSNNQRWIVNTYGPAVGANHDNYYDENMVISDLPAGDYHVMIVINNLHYQLNTTILPGRVTFFSLSVSKGFSLTLPAPADGTPIVPNQKK